MPIERPVGRGFGRRTGRRTGPDRAEPAFQVLRPPPGREVPLVVHLPHGSLRIPPPYRQLLVLDEDGLRRELLRITDRHVLRLFGAARRHGATLFVNRLSRLVVDPERFPDEREAAMDAKGLGAVYRRTSGGEPLRPPGFGRADADRLMRDVYWPYARAFADLVRELLRRHGRVRIVDGHSFPSAPLPCEEPGRRRPAFCLGYAQGRAPADWLAWWRALATGGLPGMAPVDELLPPPRPRPLVAENEPFAGSYVPLEFLDDPRVESLMIEVNRALYMDETTGAWGVPATTDPSGPTGRGRAEACRALLAAFLGHAACGGRATGAVPARTHRPGGTPS